LSIVWKYITPALLEEIVDKSQRQVFTIVSRFDPRIKHQDNTRPVMVRQVVEEPRERQHARALDSSCELALAASKQSGPDLGENHHRSGGQNLTSDEISTPVLKTETVKMHQVNCLVDDEVMQMIDRCKELMSGKYPTGMDYNTLILELTKSWLEKNDPVQRSARREKRTTKAKTRNHDSGEASRHISPETRDAVYNRDGGQCTFVGSDGKRCQSKWDLEIHHDEIPFARGGSHSLANLRLLCSVHNKLEAERVYGQNHMNKYCHRDRQTE
jgi:5-methylcytosine-specific restriction endonuclease McrA